MLISFQKLHGIGNNFILVDNRNNRLDNLSQLAKELCDVRFGLGADGLIAVEASHSSDLRMRILNADGSEPEMCGNGIRCFAKFVLDTGISDKKELSIETLAGEIKTTVLGENSSSQKNSLLVQVDMGKPILRNQDLAEDVKSPLAINIGERIYSYISMGNPHAVCFIENYQFDYQNIGKTVENNTAVFPAKTNVEFVQVLGNNEINIRVWERGCGETFACGTGACASVAAGVLTKKLDRKKVLVHLLGGDLDVEWSPEGQMMMTGPAETVCDGQFWL